MSKELKLTKEMISAEGIEIKVTQADVIDALVEEKITSILSQYEELKDSYEKINEKALKEKTDFLKKVLKKLPEIKGVTKDFECINTSEKYTQYLSISKIHCHESGSSFQFGYSNGSALLKETGVVSVRLITEIQGIVFIGWSEKLPYEYNMSEKLIKEIEAYDEKVEELFKVYPDKINEKQIARSIKNQFTKEILKSSSKDFQKKLRLGFGLNLD